MARFTPERSPRRALEDARLTFRATPCDAHVPIFFRTIAQTRSHRLTQPANSFEIHRSWKSLDRIQFVGRGKKIKEPRRFFSTFQWLSTVEKNAALDGTETRDELRVKSFWTSRPPTEYRRRDWFVVSFACDTNEAVSGLDGSLKLSIFRRWQYFGNRESNAFKNMIENRNSVLDLLLKRVCNCKENCTIFEKSEKIRDLI